MARLCCCAQSLQLFTQWVMIKETDDEKTKARKKKLQKSFKSKQRFQEMDQQTQRKAQSWQDFKSGKGAKKKVHFCLSPLLHCTVLAGFQFRQGRRKEGVVCPLLALRDKHHGLYRVIWETRPQVFPMSWHAISCLASTASHTSWPSFQSWYKISSAGTA